MIERYMVMNRDKNYGTLEYDLESKKLSFKLNENIERSRNVFALYGLYSYDQWTDLSYNPSHDDIVRWIKNRLDPKAYFNLTGFLPREVIKGKSLWELTKITRLMSLGDYIWLSKGEEFEEVHVRVLSEKTNYEGFFEFNKHLFYD